MSIITNIKKTDDGKIVIAETDLDRYIDCYIEQKLKRQDCVRHHEHKYHDSCCCSGAVEDLANDLSKTELKLTAQREILLAHIECLEKNAIESNENVKKIINMIEQKNSETNRKLNNLQSAIAIGLTVLSAAFILAQVLPYFVRL